MSEVRNHSLRDKLLLLLLLLSQRELCLQLGVGHLWLRRISSKTAEELLLSLRTSAPRVQTAGMPEYTVSNQSLEMVLLLSRSETNLRSAAAADSQPVPALEVRIVGLLLRETVRVKHILVVLQLLDPISKELARIVRRASTEVRQARRQSLRLRDRLKGILTRGGRWISSERNLLQGSGTHEILLLLSLRVNLLGVVAKQFTIAVLRWRPVDTELQLFLQMLR